MGYRLSPLGNDVYAGRMRDGSIHIEVWNVPKPAHPVIADYEDCDEVVIPASAVEQLFELLR